MLLLLSLQGQSFEYIFSRIDLKLLEILYPLWLYPSTHTFKTFLLASLGYIFWHDSHWKKLIIASLTATSQCGSYTSKNLWERWSIIGCTLPEQLWPGCHRGTSVLLLTNWRYLKNGSRRCNLLLVNSGRLLVSFNNLTNTLYLVLSDKNNYRNTEITNLFENCVCIKCYCFIQKYLSICLLFTWSKFPLTTDHVIIRAASTYCRLIL